MEGGSGFRNIDNGEGELDEVDLLRFRVVCLAEVPEF